LKPEDTLLECGCVPSAMIHFSCSTEIDQLKPELKHKIVSGCQASIAAYLVRLVVNVMCIFIKPMVKIKFSGRRCKIIPCYYKLLNILLALITNLILYIIPYYYQMAVVIKRVEGDIYPHDFFSMF